MRTENQNNILQTLASHGDIYSDETKVAEITKTLIENNVDLFQWFMLGYDTVSSIRAMYNWMTPNRGKMLDVGAGIGSVADVMSHITDEIKFTLLNISATQLSLCNSLRHTLVQHDIKQTPWPFPDGSFDNILVSYTLGHGGDLNTFMKECSRLLPEGGYLAIFDMISEKDELIADQLKYVVYPVGDLLQTAIENNLHIVRCGTPFPVRFLTEVADISEFQSKYHCQPVIYILVKATTNRNQ